MALLSIRSILYIFSHFNLYHWPLDGIFRFLQLHHDFMNHVAFLFKLLVIICAYVGLLLLIYLHYFRTTVVLPVPYPCVSFLCIWMQTVKAQLDCVVNISSYALVPSHPHVSRVKYKIYKPIFFRMSQLHIS